MRCRYDGQAEVDEEAACARRRDPLELEPSEEAFVLHCSVARTTVSFVTAIGLSACTPPQGFIPVVHNTSEVPSDLSIANVYDAAVVQAGILTGAEALAECSAAVCSTVASPGPNCAAEICDGLDNDCNGIIDDLDVNGDGICDCLTIAT